MDGFQSQPPEVKCQTMSIPYRWGMQARNDSLPVNFEPAEHIQKWETLEPEMQDMAIKAMTLGWNAANDLIVADHVALNERDDPEWKGKVNERPLGDWRLDELQNEFIQTCVNSMGSFKKTASNQMPAFMLRARILQTANCIASVERWERKCNETGQIDCTEQLLKQFEGCLQVKCTAITDEDLGIGEKR